MSRWALFFVGLFCAFFFSLTSVNADNTSIEDLLSLDEVLMTDKNEESKSLDQNPDERINMDDFLGPEDIFPFLPDNHRDSGTGRFNSF